MFSRLINWFTVEPAISLLMAITAVVIFGSAFTHKDEDAGDRFWPWLRRIIEASIGAIMFLGILWSFRAILNDNVQTFNTTHGSRTEINRESAYSIWGRPHAQRELSVEHSREVEVREEIPRDDPTKPPAYRTTVEIRTVPQNSIRGFRGQVDMELSEREKGYGLYAGYLINATYTYDIINDSDYETEAEFTFPLSNNQTLYKDFMITMDDEDISTQLRFAQDLVWWVVQMKPHQQSTVVVSYNSRGMDYFYYYIPTQREIKDFEFVLTVDRLPVSLLNYPEGVLTPTSIQATNNGQGSILTWKLNRAITTTGMGVALLQPEQPGADVLRVLVNSPYAITILGTMLALTLLILGRPVQFLDLALIAAVYCVQFLVMAGVSDFFFGFWGSMILGALLTGAMTFLLFRRLDSKLLKWLIFGLVGFFTLVYPLSGLLDQVIYRDAFDNLVLVGMIIYIFGLTLYRRRQTESVEPTL
ncbi:MAG: hypothetical protein JXB38_21745 [Anaerolineales bacterium]|nr:hypothetical protein [Anaerolineales bacterium]